MPVSISSIARLFSLVFLLSMFTACSSDDFTPTFPASLGDTDNITPDIKVEGIDFEIEKAAQASFDNSTSTCEDPNECPSYVGSLFTFEERSAYDSNFKSSYKFFVGFCSQQLIGPNLVLTNSHCVPDAIKKEGADCTGVINIKFPATKDHTAESIHCNKVLKISSKYSSKAATQPDWAILELKKSTTRPYLTTSTQGVPIGSSLTAYPSYFSKSIYYMNNGQGVNIGTGRIRKASCTSTSTNLLSSGYFHKQSTLTVATCDKDMIPGNSGAGLYNSSNQLVALGSFALNSGRPIYYQGNKYVLQPKILGGTNLHCISYFNSNPSPFCDFVDSKDMQRFNSVTSLISATTKAIQTQDSLQLDYSNNLAWGPNVRTFHEQFGTLPSINKMISNIPRHLYTHLLDSHHEKTNAKAPVCVHPDAPDYFFASAPLLSPSKTDSKLSEIGELKVAVEINGHKFSLERSSSNSSIYKTALVRLESPWRKKYHDLKNKVDQLKKDCLSGGIFLSRILCGVYKKEAQKALQWPKDNSLDPMVISNENAIRYNVGLKAELTLPVCTDLQVSESL